jgi:hypothetical protein
MPGDGDRSITKRGPIPAYFNVDEGARNYLLRATRAAVAILA